MTKSDVRPTRLLYVENDSALRRILGEMLSKSKDLELIGSFSKSSIYFQLAPRQRSIMSLSSQGKSAQDIAVQLDLSYSYVRKELSRAYSILLPDAAPSDDLKTAAVLRYMELMRMN